MAANLVRRYEPAEAHHLLNLSFAQYQADRAVVRMETRIERAAARLESLQAEAACERGDIEEYRALVRAAAEQQRVRRTATASGLRFALSRLSPGVVVDVEGERLAVLSVAFRKGGAVRAQTINAAGERVTLDGSSLSEVPARVGHIDLPVPYQPNNRDFQHQVADALRRTRFGRRDRAEANGGDDGDDGLPVESGDSGGDGDDSGGGPTQDLTYLVSAHPVDGCPDRERHLRSAAHAERAAKELGDLRREVRSRTESLARRFDRVLRLLESWGHLEGWSLTERGRVLARTYHECDLLVAEAMASGALDGLDPATLAGLVSCFTYEHRGPTPSPPPWFPSKVARERWGRISQLAEELVDDEGAAGLPPTRLPDAGFLALAHAWAAGEPLADVLDDEELSGGDFVRNIKTLIDLLRQVGEIAPVPATAATARQAAEALHRGVVAASSTLDETDEEGEEVEVEDDAGPDNGAAP
jgi:ATP-dependent RNA helicase HelY